MGKAVKTSPLGTKIQRGRGWEKGARTLGTVTVKTIGDAVRKIAVIADARFADERPRLADVVDKAVIRVLCARAARRGPGVVAQPVTAMMVTYEGGLAQHRPRPAMSASMTPGSDRTKAFACGVLFEASRGAQL